MTRIRFHLGVLASVLWLLASAILLWLKRAELASMPPNAWGDFFAGAFAPLAFLWLVLGYLQQGEELRLSTDALRLQAEELRNSVEQQRLLAETARLQLENEREALAEERLQRKEQARPAFSFSGMGASFRGDGSCRYSFTLTNTGNAATALLVDAVIPMESPFRILEAPLFERGRQQALNLESSVPLISGTQVLLVYRDTLGNPYGDTYLVQRGSDDPRSLLSFTRIEA